MFAAVVAVDGRVASPGVPKTPGALHRSGRRRGAGGGRRGLNLRQFTAVPLKPRGRVRLWTPTWTRARWSLRLLLLVLRLLVLRLDGAGPPREWLAARDLGPLLLLQHRAPILDPPPFKPLVESLSLGLRGHG